MQFRAYINNLAEITFADIHEAARFRAFKEDHKGAAVTIIEGEAAAEPQKRTEQQNKSLHLYCQHVADALNDAGYPIRKTLQSYKAEIDWNKDSVKEIIWRPAQKAITGKTSTTELSKQQEINLVYETCNRFLAQLGIHVPFPSYEPGHYDTAPLKSDV